MKEEAHIHACFRELAKRLFSETYIRVDRVVFEWIDVTGAGGKPEQLLVATSCETTAMHGATKE